MNKKPEKWRGFYFITDAGLSKNGIIVDVKEALSVGVAMVQYREKIKGYDERRSEALRIFELCRAAGTPFIVNDDVELAREIGADGVHVGQSDMALSEARKTVGDKAIVGVSAGNVEEARLAIAGGADYLGPGPIFATATKADAGEAVGVGLIKTIRAITDIPMAAIGGIGRDNASSVIQAGADMICAISASLAGGKVAENIRALLFFSH